VENQDLKKLGIEDIQQILESGEFDSLIGTQEDDTLECKAEPYQLDGSHAKLELAKDVSALANARGGIILIGVRTERDPSHPAGDQVTEIRPFVDALVNPDQCCDILKKWIYPPLQGPAIRWHGSRKEAEKGIVSIHVPEQPKSNWPFLITRVPDEHGKNRGIVFGYTERRQSVAEPASLEVLHSLIRDGARFDTLNQKIVALQDAVNTIALKEQAATSVPREELDLRVGLTLSELELGSTSPTYILAAAPMETIQLPTLFDSREAAIVKLMENPPEIRDAGFSIHIGDSARIIAGERRRVLRKKERVLNCWRDGTAVYACDGDYIFWGEFQFHNRIINQLCLIETIYLFTTFTMQLYEDATPKPKKIAYRLEIRNMTRDGINPGLIPGPLLKRMWTSDSVRATSGSKVITVEHSIENSAAGEIAFKLVSEFYAWMGLDADKIPYKEKAGPNWVISPEEMRRMYPA